MSWVVIFRILQAIGACVGPMISRAMVRDLYTGPQAARMLSTLMVIAAMAPVFGPLLGGLLMGLGSWQILFYFMALMGILLLLLSFFLPETRPQLSGKSSNTSLIAFKNYCQLCRTKAFMFPTLSVTFFYVCIYAFVTGSSSIYITYYHVPPADYGYFFGVNTLGIIGLNLANRCLV